jgi:hypothetical protein
MCYVGLNRWRRVGDFWVFTSWRLVQENGLLRPSEEISGSPGLWVAGGVEAETPLLGVSGSPVCQCCFPITVGGRAERRREGQAVVQEQTGLSLCFGQSSEEKMSGLFVGWECGRLKREEEDQRGGGPVCFLEEKGLFFCGVLSFCKEDGGQAFLVRGPNKTPSRKGVGWRLVCR